MWHCLAQLVFNWFQNTPKILYSIFWDNPLIVRNRAIKKTDFPEISRKITFFQDFFKIGTNEVLSREELQLKYEIEININTYIELSYIIKSTIQKIGLRRENLPIVQLPIQPVLVNVAMLTEKGCNRYYKLLRKKKNLSNSMHERESIWHKELNSTYGVQFWNKVYTITAEIKNDNRLKWLQYQIARNSLFTNYKVNKFNPNVSPLCSNCNNIEKTSHLLWGCDKVLELWQQIHYFLSNFQISLDYSLKTVLFGNHNEPCDSVLNFTILIAKGYIWKSKFDKSPISFIAFKKYFKHKLEDLKDSCNYIDKMFLFDRWINIYASL